jgi:hypothetical protein
MSLTTIQQKAALEQLCRPYRLSVPRFCFMQLEAKKYLYDIQKWQKIFKDVILKGRT